LAGGILYLLIYITVIPLLKAITFYELEALELVLNRIKPIEKIVKPLLAYEKKILEYTKPNTVEAQV
jgi:hypothetical protein